MPDTGFGGSISAVKELHRVHDRIRVLEEEIADRRAGRHPRRSARRAKMAVIAAIVVSIVVLALAVRVALRSPRIPARSASGSTYLPPPRVTTQPDAIVAPVHSTGPVIARVAADGDGEDMIAVFARQQGGSELIALRRHSLQVLWRRPLPSDFHVDKSTVLHATGSGASATAVLLGDGKRFRSYGLKTGIPLGDWLSDGETKRRASEKDIPPCDQVRRRWPCASSGNRNIKGSVLSEVEHSFETQDELINIGWDRAVPTRAGLTAVIQKKEDNDLVYQGSLASPEDVEVASKPFYAIVDKDFIVVYRIAPGRYRVCTRGLDQRTFMTNLVEVPDKGEMIAFKATAYDVYLSFEDLIVMIDRRSYSLPRVEIHAIELVP